jgi:hypothetical protein
MNLFLLSQSALIAVVTGATGTEKTGLFVNRPALGGWIYLGWYALHAAACNFQQDRSGNASSA